MTILFDLIPAGSLLCAVVSTGIAAYTYRAKKQSDAARARLETQVLALENQSVSRDARDGLRTHQVILDEVIRQQKLFVEEEGNFLDRADEQSKDVLDRLMRDRQEPRLSEKNFEQMKALLSENAVHLKTVRSLSEGFVKRLRGILVGEKIQRAQSASGSPKGASEQTARAAENDVVVPLHRKRRS
jgi:hypothetical protein